MSFVSTRSYQGPIGTILYFLRDFVRGFCTRTDWYDFLFFYLIFYVVFVPERTWTDWCDFNFLRGVCTGE